VSEGVGAPAPPQAVGDHTGIQGDYTSPDALDEHRHAILPGNFNKDTGHGVTEIEGGLGTSYPAHAHAIVDWYVEPYKKGSYVSAHGSYGASE